MASRKSTIKNIAFLAIVLVPLLILLLYQFVSYNYNIRSKEAKKVLLELYEKQEQYKRINGEYSPSFENLSWEPHNIKYYCYYLSSYIYI